MWFAAYEHLKIYPSSHKQKTQNLNRYPKLYPVFAKETEYFDSFR